MKSDFFTPHVPPFHSVWPVWLHIRKGHKHALGQHPAHYGWIHQTLLGDTKLRNTVRASTSDSSSSSSSFKGPSRLPLWKTRLPVTNSPSLGATLAWILSVKNETERTPQGMLWVFVLFLTVLSMTVMRVRIAGCLSIVWWCWCWMKINQMFASKLTVAIDKKSWIPYIP